MKKSEVSFLKSLLIHLFRVKLVIVLSLFSMLVTSCGDSSSPDVTLSDGDTTKKNEKLEALYGSLLGEYEGEIANPNDKNDHYPIRLSIRLQRLPNGIDENGRPQFVVSPLAWLRRERGIEPDHFLNIDYSKETGALYFTNLGQADKSGLNGPTTGPDGKPSKDEDDRPGTDRPNKKSENSIYSLVLTAIAAQGSLTSVRLQINGAMAGIGELRKSSKASGNYHENNYLETRARLNKAYEPIMGAYKGHYLTQIMGEQPLQNKFELQVFSREVAVDSNDQGEPIYWPELIARYQQLTCGKILIAQPIEFMNARYFPNQKICNNSAQCAVGQPVGELILQGQKTEIRMFVSPDSSTQRMALKGRFQDHSGPLGEAVASYVGPATGTPDGIDEEFPKRQRELWQKIVGEYEGRVVFSSWGEKEIEFNGVLKIAITELSVPEEGLKETLTANFSYFKKSDPSDTHEFFMIGNYLPKQSQLLFSTSYLEDIATTQFFSMTINGMKIDWEDSTEVKEVAADVVYLLGPGRFQGTKVKN